MWNSVYTGAGAIGLLQQGHVRCGCHERPAAAVRVHLGPAPPWGTAAWQLAPMQTVIPTRRPRCHVGACASAGGAAVWPLADNRTGPASLFARAGFRKIALYKATAPGRALIHKKPRSRKLRFGTCDGAGPRPLAEGMAAGPCMGLLVCSYVGGWAKPGAGTSEPIEPRPAQLNHQAREGPLAMGPSPLSRLAMGHCGAALLMSISNPNSRKFSMKAGGRQAGWEGPRECAAL